MSTFVMIDAPALLRVTTTRPCGCVPPAAETTDYQTSRAIVSMEAATHDSPDGEWFDGFTDIDITAFLVGQKTVQHLAVWLPAHCRVEAWRTGRSLRFGDEMTYHLLPRVADGTRTFQTEPDHRCDDAQNYVHPSRHYSGMFEGETGVAPFDEQWIRDQWARP